MERILRLTPRFRADIQRLGASGSTPPRRALASTLTAMLAAELPGPLDFEAMIPPTRFAWVRRVPGCNLWVFYTFDAAELRAVALTASPPVPLFG